MPRKILIFITVDNLSCAELACYGNEHVQTPGLDELVIQGVLFDEHYASTTNVNASLTAWATGLAVSSAEQNNLEEASLGQLLQFLENQQIATFHIDDQASQNETQSQLHLFFEELNQKQANVFCWIQTSADQLESVVSQIQKKLKTFLAENAECSIAWGITSENLSSWQDQSEYTATYADPLQNSLSRKLKRPLIISGNFLPENCPQRFSHLTIAQDLYWTIIDYLDLDIKKENSSKFYSLLPALFDEKRETTCKQRQLVLLDENVIGLRTATDFTVLDRESIDANQQIAIEEICFYLKPDDAFDINDISSNDPETVQQRLQCLLQQSGCVDKIQ